MLEALVLLFVTKDFKMIKYQSIVDLWDSWGDLLDRGKYSNSRQTSIELDIVLSRLTMLCISNHDMEMSDVIREYTRLGWID